MKTVGLIAEYNPFHNGHEFHIKKAKEITGADRVVVVMSGDYVQRGTPALMPMQLRAASALVSGADLILMLPVRYATSSAENFAYGAVAMLDQLGCVDALCFGSEAGSLHNLITIAEILVDEPKSYRAFLQTALKQGLSYPAARSLALYAYTKDMTLKEALEMPNNILGIEYLKALLQLGSSIQPYTIPREDSGYHSTNLDSSFSSATAIRKLMDKDAFPESLATYMPEKAYHLLKAKHGTRFPITADDFSLLCKQSLLRETKDSLLQYEDMSKDLAYRILGHLDEFVTFTGFCEVLKTKEITYNRISRALLHVMLGIRKQEFKSRPHFARVLGFTKQGTEIMTEIKRKGSLPLVTKLGNATVDMAEDTYAINLYESVVTEKFHTPFYNEKKHPILRL